MSFIGKLFGSNKSRRKALIIGLDGVPCSFMKQLIDEGLMPNTKALVSTGTLRR